LLRDADSCILSLFDGNETERTSFGCRISPNECAGQVSRSQLDSSYPRKTGDVDPGGGSRLSYLIELPTV
jgi:hypothetical protein